jgi:DNA primase
MQLLRISREQIDAIKRRVDIAAVIAERGITLRRVGRTLFGLCVFHEEKTPSFAVSPERGLFHCFGCSVGGDVFGFVMRVDRVSFPEAVRLLAKRVGIELREPEATTRREDTCGRASWR